MLVGIDWGRLQHVVSLLQNSGKLITVLKIKTNYEGYLELLEHLRSAEGEVIFAIENRNLRIVDFLIASGYSGFYVDPNAMSRYRDRYRSAPVKSDELDAFILADLLRTDRHNLPAIVLDNPFVRELKTLLADRDRLIRDEIRLVNRLKGCLVEYYPEALEFFEEPAGKVALEFLATYPTLEQARQLTTEEIEKFLAARHLYRNRAEVAQRIVEIVRGPTVGVLDDIVRTKSRLLLAIIKQIEPLREIIAEYEEEIRRLVDGNDDVAIFLSLPGVATVLGARLYTLFASSNRPKDLVDLRAHIGMAPVTCQSGQFKGVSFRYACDKFDRNTLHQVAFCSLRESEWAREHYRRDRRQGKNHHHALRCLGDLWVKVINAMWRKKEHYDEQKHLASVARFWLRNNNQEAWGLT